MDYINRLLNRVSLRDRAFLIRQLSIMVSSDVAIVQALSLASQQTSNPKLQQAMRIMMADIQNGHSFSMAASRFPELFDAVDIAMLKSGEATGQLQLVLQEMSKQAEKNLDFLTKVRNALIYPAFVVSVMIVVAIIMTTVIVPRLTSVFEETDIALPWTTQILIAISNALINYWYIFVILLVGIILFLRSFLATPSGREAFYHFQMRIPVIKTLIVNSYLVRFTTVLAMLVRSGVPISEALRIVAESMANRVWIQRLQVVREEVERGIPLSAALARHDIFPKPLTQMLTVGEQTGKVDGVLDTMSQFYEEQTNAAVKAMTSLIEPVVLVIVAIGVGFVVVSVILPIYGLADQF